jgi:hypothetical protein
MKKLVWSFVFTMSACGLQAQDGVAAKHNSIGFELDALPYITGGYYGSVWVGHNQLRYRAVIAKVTAPDFLLPDEFTNNKIQAYAAIADYFFRPDFNKWWIGTGFEYWRGTIQTDARLRTGKYYQTIFTLGGGYVWKFHGNFYLNPWAAFHARIVGDTSVSVEGKEFNPPAVAPEISLKIGWYF